MPDRLQELLRQRAAIQTHLAWLDGEIAAAKPSGTATSISQPDAATIQPLPDHDSATPGTLKNETDPDAILAGYRQNTQNLRTDVRKGCLLYFFAAFFLLGLGVVSFYFVNRLIQPHSGRPAPSEQRASPPVER